MQGFTLSISRQRTPQGRLNCPLSSKLLGSTLEKEKRLVHLDAQAFFLFR
jgi:hypothetical protein